MEQMFNVSSNPHVRARMTTAKIMQLVVIALLPAALMGIYNHGLKALAVLVVSTGSAALAEWLYDHFMHKKNTVKDFSAVVTGLLIGLNMPAGIPLWIPVLGSIFAIIVVKQLFGGLGQNFINPALAARCFLMISFAGKMTDFSVSDSFKGAVDGVTGATPLAALRDHGFVAGSSVPVKNLIFGNIQGTIGETSVIAILIGAAILLCYKVISARIPLTYIGSFAVFVIIYMLASGKGSPIFVAVVLCLVHGLWQQITLQAPLHQRGSMYMASVLVFLPEFSVFSELPQRAFPMRLFSATCWYLRLSVSPVRLLLEKEARRNEK